jgi:hypothetical protein
MTSSFYLFLNFNGLIVIGGFTVMAVTLIIAVFASLNASGQSYDDG